MEASSVEREDAGIEEVLTAGAGVRYARGCRAGRAIVAPA